MSGYARGVSAIADEALVAASRGRTATSRGARSPGPTSFIVFCAQSAASLMFGRAGQTRAVDVGEIARDLHHLRALEPFLLDPVNRVEVEFLGDRPVGGHRHAQKRDDACDGK